MGYGPGENPRVPPSPVAGAPEWLWRCGHKRSHGYCNTLNEIEDSSCGACGEDRPAFPRAAVAGSLGGEAAPSSEGREAAPPFTVADAVNRMCGALHNGEPVADSDFHEAWNWAQGVMWDRANGVAAPRESTPHAEDATLDASYDTMCVCDTCGAAYCDDGLDHDCEPASPSAAAFRIYGTALPTSAIERPPASSSEGVETRAETRIASAEARKIVENYEIVACNLRTLGAGELADAERLVLGFIADLEAEVSRLRASLAEEQRMSGPPENVTTVMTPSGFLAGVNADVYYKQGL